MFVKQWGAGPRAFFCLHGWSGDHRTFEPLAPFLPGDARMYSADLPGCGASPDPERWNLDTTANEVARTIAGVNVDGITLVGSCIGALIGLRAALQIPHAVQRIILIDTFASWPWYFRVFTAPGWGKYAYATTFANPIGRWMTNRALASRRSNESNLTEGFTERRHDVTLRYLQVVREIQSPAEFAGLDVPVDIVFGSRTFRAIHQSATVWKQLWPRAEIWEVPGAGHLLLREAPAAVSGIIFEGGACLPESVTMSNSARI